MKVIHEVRFPHVSQLKNTSFPITSATVHYTLVYELGQHSAGLTCVTKELCSRSLPDLLSVACYGYSHSSLLQLFLWSDPADMCNVLKGWRSALLYGV